MEILIASLFILLFLISFKNSNYFLLVFPIFIFCYPENSNFISISGFGLDDVMIFIGFGRSVFVKDSSTLKYRWRVLHLSVLILFIFSNLTGYLVDDFVNFDLLLFVKSLINNFYWYAITCIYIAFSSKVSLSVILKGIVFSVLIQAIIGIVVYYYFSEFSFFYSASDSLLEPTATLRAVGSTRGPWELGGFLVIGFLLIFKLSIDDNRYINKYILICSIFLIVIALILTFSRASWGFLLVGVLVILISHPIKTFKKLIFIFPILLLIGLPFLEELLSMIDHRINYTFNGSSGGELDTSSQARIDIWKMFMDKYNFGYFLQGYGWQNIKFIFGTTPHNGILSLFLSSGLFGIYIFYRIFIFLIRYEINSNVIPFYPILIGYSFYMLTTDSFFTDSVVILLNILYTSLLFYNPKMISR